MPTLALIQLKVAPSLSVTVDIEGYYQNIKGTGGWCRGQLSLNIDGKSPCAAILATKSATAHGI